MSKPAKYIEPLSKMLNPLCREVEPTPGDTSYAEFAVKEIDQANRTVRATVSTAEVDRYQEIVEPKAFEKWLKHFEANPVMLAAHDHSAWSTGEPTVIGRWMDIQIGKDGLSATGQFMPEDPLAERYWKRYRDGYMKAFSVGFIAHSWEMREFTVGEGVTKRLRVFTEVELLEISAVAVPANRGALARAASFLAGRAGDGESPDQPAALAKALRDAVGGDIEKTITDQLSKLSAPDGPLAKLFAVELQAAIDREGTNDYFKHGDPGTTERSAGLTDFQKELSDAIG